MAFENNYGLGNTRVSQNDTKGDNSPFLSVRVIDIILDSSHPDWANYGGWDALGMIKFIPYYSDLDNLDTSINIAKPLFSNVKNYPLLQETTWVLQLPDPMSADSVNFSSFYYINSINVWNHPHHNALPKIDYSKLPENLKLNYKEIETGLVRQQASESKNFKLGNTFKEKSNIKPLLPFEGDVIHEGRFGQSIRFSSTVKEKNPWSFTGNDGNPILIIRNGQRIDIPDSDKGWIPIIEDINGDGSSIYFCDGQTIPINVASTNLKSFTSILQTVNSPTIQILDNPILSPTLPASSSDNLPSSSIENSQPKSTTTVSNNTTLSGSNTTLNIKPSYDEEEIQFSFPGEEVPLFIFQTDDIDEELEEIEREPEKYNAQIMSNESSKTKNEAGEYAIWISGKIVGYSPVVYINQIRVAKTYEPYLRLLLDAAKKEGVAIAMHSSFRTFDEQIDLRKKHAKDKTKINDIKFLEDAPSDQFVPKTGKPGYSQHQNGKATDFNTSNPSVYKWLVKNAIKFGYVRTVQSERWHWEYIPNANQFSYIPKTDSSWDNLV